MLFTDLFPLAAPLQPALLSVAESGGGAVDRFFSSEVEPNRTFKKDLKVPLAVLTEAGYVRSHSTVRRR